MVNLMEQRKVGVLCVQETRRKGAKARCREVEDTVEMETKGMVYGLY